MRTIHEDTMTCPVCHRDALEYFVSMRRAKNIEARRTETKGERAGQPYVLVAGCESCGSSFEVVDENRKAYHGASK